MARSQHKHVLRTPNRHHPRLLRLGVAATTAFVLATPAAAVVWPDAEDSRAKAEGQSFAARPQPQTDLWLEQTEVSDDLLPAARITARAEPKGPDSSRAGDVHPRERGRAHRRSDKTEQAPEVDGASAAAQRRSDHDRDPEYLASPEPDSTTRSKPAPSSEQPEAPAPASTPAPAPASIPVPAPASTPEPTASSQDTAPSPAPAVQPTSEADPALVSAPVPSSAPEVEPTNELDPALAPAPAPDPALVTESTPTPEPTPIVEPTSGPEGYWAPGLNRLLDPTPEPTPAIPAP